MELPIYSIFNTFIRWNNFSSFFKTLQPNAAVEIEEKNRSHLWLEPERTLREL